MRPYEMMVLLSAEVEDPKDEVEKIEEVVRNLGGEAVKTDFWGKRRLAYPIDKKYEGYYEVCNFSIDPGKLVELNRVLGLRPAIYRQMAVSLDEK